MKLKYIAILAVGCTVIKASADDIKPTSPHPLLPPPSNSGPPTAPPKDQLSYAVGMNFGRTIKQNNLDVDIDAVAAAMKDVLAGGTTKYTQMETQEIITRWKRAEQFKQKQEQDEKSASNKKTGEDYRAKFAKEPGVITMTNGLEYKIITEGTGELAKTTDTVTIKYRGTFVDGTEFDHSDAFTTVVTGRTITGWSQVMPLMKVGTKLQAVIPPDLAYGPFGQTPKIPPMATLIFDMEMTAIQSNPAGAVPAAPVLHSTSAPISAQPQGQVVSGQIIKVPSAEELKKGAKIEVIEPGAVTNGAPK